MHQRHLLIIGTLALARASLTAQAPAIRDSADVRIIENRARLTFPVNLKLGQQPILDVGGLHNDNPDEEFNASQGYLRGVRLSDGGLVAIDVNKVKYFDATGRLLKVAGRDGAGPGEFTYLTAICRTRGDTIVVADRTRLAVLDKQGRFVRHISTTPRDLPFDGCFDDGTLLLTKAEYRVPTPTTRTVHLWRVRLDGTVAASLGDMVVAGLDMITQGEITWAAAGSRLLVGDGTRKDIPVFQLLPMAPPGMAPSGNDGAPMRLAVSIRTADPSASISDADVEKRILRTIPRNVSIADRTARMRMKTLPHASTWPAIGRIYADPEGNLWVADYLRYLPSPIGYSKFDPSGRLIGRLLIPAATYGVSRLEVLGFGRNDILVRRWDEDGAAHLTVYPIVPAP